MELVSQTLDVSSVISQIAKTFRSTQDIRRQFELDYYRMTISINNLALSHEEFLDTIKPYYRYAISIPGAPVITNLYYLVMMLCTQASFFDAYTSLANYYQLPNHKLSYHLMSSSGESRDETDQYISLSLKNELIIRFIKTFYCKNISNDSMVASYQTITTYRMEPIDHTLTIEIIVEWCKI
jgi:hypothetical protein